MTPRIYAPLDGIEGRNTETDITETYVLTGPVPASFTLAHPYRAATLTVWLNGLRLVSGADFVASDDGPIVPTDDLLYVGDTVQLRYTPRPTSP